MFWGTIVHYFSMKSVCRFVVLILYWNVYCFLSIMRERERERERERLVIMAQQPPAPNKILIVGTSLY